MRHCDNCGAEESETNPLILVNVEPPRYGMRDPYPGYEGDLVCEGGCRD